VMTLLILGIMFGYAVNALVSVLIHFSVSERVHAYVSWTFGSFASVTRYQLRVFVPVALAGIVASFGVVKTLNALLLGETYGESMGLDVERARVSIILITAVLSGSVTAFCGPVAFIGIAVPHLCRSLFGTSDHRVILPASLLTGGITALLADVVAQLPGSTAVLPLNAVTSLVGAPVVIWFILKRKPISETFAS
ncbi:MAG: iron chelate uptake ABC transporter family permease subunit, partial [Candidatus Latescibacteria bacterium]|nr:iron chelate uptake ABC transporter family permease subunit [Candidatus Latescibacterota bacterium]